MDDMSVEDLVNRLEHYGVLGMKWGVRKDRRNGVAKGGKPAAPKKPAKPKVTPAKAEKPKSASGMTDQELRDGIARRKLEDEFRRLTAAPPTTRQRMIASVKSAVASGASKSLNYGTEQLGRAVVDSMLLSMGIRPSSQKKNEKKTPPSETSQKIEKEKLKQSKVETKKQKQQLKNQQQQPKQQQQQKQQNWPPPQPKKKTK